MVRRAYSKPILVPSRWPRPLMAKTEIARRFVNRQYIPSHVSVVPRERAATAKVVK
jgi:hypothetical protein